MSTTTLSALPPASIETLGASRATGRVVAALRNCIARFSMDDRSRYMSAARDHVDLERRERAWDEHQRQQASFFLL